MNITIKKMKSDAEIMGKAYVHWRSWQEAYRGIVNRQYLDRLTLEKCEEIARRWPDDLLVAKDGDRVIGFVGYGKAGDEDLDDAGEIFALYILTEYYGQGVGYRLMQAGLDRLRDCSEIVVRVLKENERAVRFYERCGFRFDGREETVVLGSPAVTIQMRMER